MLIINCPYCGPRDQAEFRYGEEERPPRPVDPAQLSDEEWARYLFYRRNAKGLTNERWVHSFGCGQWFRVVRDTVTHEIVETAPLTSPPGEGTMPDG